MICLKLNWLFYDPICMLQLSEFVWTLRSSAWVVFNNFLQQIELRLVVIKSAYVSQTLPLRRHNHYVQGYSRHMRLVIVNPWVLEEIIFDIYARIFIKFWFKTKSRKTQCLTQGIFSDRNKIQNQINLFWLSSFSVIFHFLNFLAQIYILNNYAAIVQFKIKKRLYISGDSADNFRIVDLLSLLISRLI